MTLWWRICLPVPETQEIQIQSLGWEDPLEEGMATQSNNLAWKIPWTEEPGGPQCMGSQRVRHNWVTKLTSTPPNTQSMNFFYTCKAGDFSRLQRWTAWIKTPTVVGTSMVVQWLRLHPPTEGALGTRSHVQKLRVGMQQLKVLHVATKNRCRQMYQKHKLLKTSYCCMDTSCFWEVFVCNMD